MTSTLEAHGLVVSPLFARLDHSLLPLRPSSNVGRVNTQSQGHLIKIPFMSVPAAERDTRPSILIQSRGFVTRSGLLSFLILHPAEKFHGFQATEEAIEDMRRLSLDRTD
jgi:hypothetical protein